MIDHERATEAGSSCPNYGRPFTPSLAIMSTLATELSRLTAPKPAISSTKLLSPSMPAKKKTAKKAAKIAPENSFEESLRETTSKLRGSIESSEYKRVVLSPIFLKSVFSKFEERRAELISAYLWFLTKTKKVVSKAEDIIKAFSFNPDFR